MTTLVRLSLAFPPSLEAAITEVLIAAPELPGFTLFNAEGHSSDFSSASTAERIRGRIDQRVLWMIVEQGSYQQVLALLRGRYGADRVPPLAVTLTKRLPVAAGIGGGSADAAAMARLIRTHFLPELGDATLARLVSQYGLVDSAHAVH